MGRRDRARGQRGRLRPYVANIAVNLWGRDILQNWNTQIKISASSKTYVSGKKNVRRYYRQRSPAI